MKRVTEKIAKVFLAGFLLLLFPHNVSLSYAGEDGDKRPNIIFIVVDCLRADHLACYGYSRNTSPNIDRFASEGVLFKNCFSSGTYTYLSAPSILTSLPASVHGVRRELQGMDTSLLTLPEILADSGYKTAAFVGPHLRLVLNFSLIFQHYQRCIPGDDPSENRFLVRAKQEQITSGLIIGAALHWLEERGDEPFFIYMHFLDVHAPYSPPEIFKTSFWKKPVPDEAKAVFKSMLQKRRNPALLAYAHLKDYIISQYDAEILSMDVKISNFLDKIKEMGLDKNTIVILVGDHGEGFGEHGLFFHGENLGDEVMHVPLIMRLPGVFPEGLVVDKLVRLIDIMPTLLDGLNIDLKQPSQGESLWDNIVNGKAFPELTVFCETRKSVKVALRTDKWKLVASHGWFGRLSHFKLYDLLNDPLEKENVIRQNPEVKKQLLAELRKRLRRFADLRRDCRKKRYE